ncbi:MAG: FlgD immunoglobulin-like domain containing protein [Candidatus Neomarinimicrobiota bacterium]
MFGKVSKVYLLIFVSSLCSQTTAPEISSITSTTDAGSYNLGSSINITLNFSKAVSLIDARLEIVLETGDTDRSIYIEAFATASLSASSTYIVQRGDETSQLSVKSITLSANGSSPSILDNQGNVMINFAPIANLENDQTFIIDGLAPDAPSGLIAVADNQSITLSWASNSEADFSKYIIYGGTGKAPTTTISTISLISQLSETITPLSNDTTYYYRMIAEDLLGNISSYSNEISSIPFSKPVAGGIRDGESTDVDWWNKRDKISFNWDEFTDNGSISYEYAIGTSLSDLKNTIPWVSVTGTGKTHAGLNLIEGFTYFISVRGTDFTGKSDTTTSNGLVIDLTAPNFGSVNDGSIEPDTDLDYSNSVEELSSNWSGFSDIISSGVASSIQSYTYSIGTSPGDSNIVLPKIIPIQNSFTQTGLSLEENSTYYFTVFATDLAGNKSNAISSNGIIIDVTDPIPGIVRDVTPFYFILNDLSDQSWINFNSSLVAYWYGFTDSLSGISNYEINVFDPDNVPVIEWKTPDNDSTLFLPGLSLEDDKTYKIAVKTTDVAGNQIIELSNGIYVDLTPPSIDSQDEKRILLSDTTKLEIVFSEEITSLEILGVSKSDSIINFWHKIKDNILTIETRPPFSSLDTISFYLNNVTDSHELVTEQIPIKFATRLLGDYDDNLIIDISDISEFANRWPTDDIAPVEGFPPYFTLKTDGIINLRDAMAFARMWRWFNEENEEDVAVPNQFGIAPNFSTYDNGFTMFLPPDVVSGEITIINADEDLILSNKNLSQEGVFLSYRNKIFNHYRIDFSKFNSTQSTKKTKLNFLADQRQKNLLFYYYLYNKEMELISSGSSTPLNENFPENYALKPNFPNPFNPSTTIPYELPEVSSIKIDIYDLVGKRIRTLVNNNMEAGFHTCVWDGKNDKGEKNAAGVYIVSMKTGSMFQTRKIVLLK